MEKTTLFLSVKGVFGFHNGRGLSKDAVRRFSSLIPVVGAPEIVLLDRGECVDEFLNESSEMVRSLIVDTVPDLSYPFVSWRPYGRLIDIIVWFALRNRLPAGWFALDGYSFEWPAWSPNVTFCNPNVGFDEDTEPRFLSMLGIAVQQERR